MNPSKADVNGNTQHKLIKVASCSECPRISVRSMRNASMSMRAAARADQQKVERVSDEARIADRRRSTRQVPTAISKNDVLVAAIFDEVSLIPRAASESRGHHHVGRFDAVSGRRRVCAQSLRGMLRASSGLLAALGPHGAGARRGERRARRACLPLSGSMPVVTCKARRRRSSDSVTALDAGADPSLGPSRAPTGAPQMKKRQRSVTAGANL
jgi:hypothetical protein